MNEELAKKAYLAYGQTTDFKNYQGLPMPEWENLPEGIQKAWGNAAGAITLTDEKPKELSPCRCYWVVEAGIIPGDPEPQFTKRFGVTQAEYERPGDITVSRMVEALEYARSLHEPQRLNWVNLQWIWC
jgi:hypothetical protein